MAGPDSEHIAEMFAAFGRVSVRRMFSGAGVFSDGLMIALISRDVVYLKTDEQTIPAFVAEGLAPFSYQRNGVARTINSFWRMPERLYDDPDELAQWARQAKDAALRADVKKPKKIAKKSTKKTSKPKNAKALKSKRRLVKKRR
jgi:DNA transformation protein and related proteins